MYFYTLFYFNNKLLYAIYYYHSFIQFILTSIYIQVYIHYLSYIHTILISLSLSPYIQYSM